MRMRALLLLTPWLSVCAACGSDEARDPGTAVPPDRIVLIVVDTLRRDHLSPYGDRVETPNVAELAESGQVFRHAYSSYHQTTMSMASLFTGLTPSLEQRDEPGSLDLTGRSWCGLLRLAEGEGDACIPRDLETLADALRDAGYWTAAVVTNKLLYEPGGYRRGFDRWEELVGFAPTAIDANRVARQVLAERPDDRFFLYVHYMDMHDYGFRRETYASGVAKIDWAVGDLLRALEEEGLRDGTVFFLTSDHGERLGEEHFTEGKPGHHGNPSFDTLLQVPLIVSPPVFEDTDRIVRSDDLHRMIRRVAGADPGPEPVLEQGELFVSERQWQTLRDGRWKIFRERDSGAIRLVDLEADPAEERDVSASHPEVVAERAARLDALRDELGASDVPPLELSDDDADRLRALGYLPREDGAARR